MNAGTYFISGIDTDAGKSVATGMLARHFMAQNISVITQKLIQTGCNGISEDIETHRRIMGIPLQPEDCDKTTCPLVFTYPASPHFAAKIDNRTVDTGIIAEATQKLQARYSTVLIEGAGGLMVPLSPDYLTIDYVAEHHLPVILVTSGRLGSINHTLLSLDACKSRNIPVAAIVFNQYPVADSLISTDSWNYMKAYTAKLYPEAKRFVLPLINMQEIDKQSIIKEEVNARLQQ